MLEAYLANDATVSAWFGGAWSTVGEIQQWYTEHGEQPSWHRAELAALAVAAIKDRAGPASAIKQAQRLHDAPTLAVVTGQQPAIGGGPLLTLSKIAHAIALTRQLEAAGTPAVTIFWCASEDHDEGEANHADLIARDGRIRRVHRALPKPGASLAWQPASDWWPALQRALHDCYPAGLGSSWWEALAPDPQEGMGRWTCRIIEQAFAGDGLICLEARELRPLAHDTLVKLIDHWPVDALAAQRDAVIAAGYEPAFPPLDSAPLFADRSDEREALDHVGARDLLASKPDLISTGAAVRPIIQQAVLPAIAYCGGPGELAYHSLLAPIYAAAQVPRPRFIPRQQLSLAPSFIARAAERWELPLSEFIADQPPRSPEPPGGAIDLSLLEQALSQLEEQQLKAPDHLKQRLAAGLARLNRETDRLAASLANGQRQRAELVPIGHLRDWLRPRNKPQDRVMSLAQAFWQFGPGIVDDLITACASGAPNQHHLITPD